MSKINLNEIQLLTGIPQLDQLLRRISNLEADVKALKDWKANDIIPKMQTAIDDLMVHNDAINKLIIDVDKQAKEAIEIAKKSDLASQAATTASDLATTAFNRAKIGWNTFLDSLKRGWQNVYNASADLKFQFSEVASRLASNVVNLQTKVSDISNYGVQYHQAPDGPSGIMGGQYAGESNIISPYAHPIITGRGTRDTIRLIIDAAKYSGDVLTATSNDFWHVRDSFVNLYNVMQGVYYNIRDLPPV